MFLWKDPDDADRERVQDELADIFSYDLDPDAIVQQKVELNRGRYPVEQARGNATKHDEP